MAELVPPKKPFLANVTAGQVWRSIFRHGYADTSRNRALQVASNVWLHLHPSKIRRHGIRFRFTWCAGGLTFLLYLVTVVTGVVLMFLYVPSVERAYSSVKDIEFVVSFGWLLRAMHRIAAHAMVAAVFLHMVRVFLTGGYKNGTAVGANRPLNWIIGLVLLIVTLLLSFTGYLLPWDQLAYWAITVGTNIASAAPIVGKWTRFILLGGNEIDQNALIRFYVLHVFFLPMIVIFLFSYHMWRVRKDGGLAARLGERHDALPALARLVVLGRVLRGVLGLLPKLLGHLGHETQGGLGREEDADEELGHLRLVPEKFLRVVERLDRVAQALHRELVADLGGLLGLVLLVLLALLVLGHRALLVGGSPDKSTRSPSYSSLKFTVTAIRT